MAKKISFFFFNEDFWVARQLGSIDHPLVMHVSKSISSIKGQRKKTGSAVLRGNLEPNKAWEKLKLHPAVRFQDPMFQTLLCSPQ